MANQEHLDILRQGVEVWNRWRKEHADIKPNLSEATLNEIDLSYFDLSEVKLSKASLYRATLTFTNFSEADLSGAKLSKANLSNAKLIRATLIGATLNDADLREATLSGADLSFIDLYEASLHGADLIGARLHEATLSRADLSFTDLDGAILSEASLYGVNLWGANLYGADLYKADLVGAVLNEAELIGADLSEATVGSTSFGDCDLRVVKGLETVRHRGPSPLSIKTIYLSEGGIPEVFLRGAGIPDAFITYIRSFVGKAIEYYSCFISYSSKDEAFAKRLYADLQSHNVRCWFAPEDMKIGDRIRPRIDESIRLHDKLLLVLSEHSVASKWVEFEVEAAMDKEQEGKPPVLFPVRLDNAVMDSTTAWAAHIKRTRHIGNFTNWKNHDDYQKAFARLLRNLKASS